MDWRRVGRSLVAGAIALFSSFWIAPEYVDAGNNVPSHINLNQAYGFIFGGSSGQACVFDIQAGYYGGAYANAKMRSGYQCGQINAKAHTPGALPAGPFRWTASMNVWISSGSPGNPFSYAGYRVFTADQDSLLCITVWSTGSVFKHEDDWECGI
jgi:hypothetical protein